MTAAISTALLAAVLAIVVILLILLWVLVAVLRRQNDEDALGDDARVDSVIAALAKAERDISHRPRVRPPPATPTMRQ